MSLGVNTIANNRASAAHWLNIAGEARRMAEWERLHLGFNPEAGRNTARLYARTARSVRRGTCLCCDKPWDDCPYKQARNLRLSGAWKPLPH